MKIHRVVSDIWPWEFSLLHLKREVFLRIPEYAGVVWSSVVLQRRKPENPWSSKQVSRVPLYASAPIAYDGTVYARVDLSPSIFQSEFGKESNIEKIDNFSRWRRTILSMTLFHRFTPTSAPLIAALHGSARLSGAQPKRLHAKYRATQANQVQRDSMCSHQTAHARNVVVSNIARPKPLCTKHRATQSIHTDEISVLSDK